MKTLLLKVHAFSFLKCLFLFILIASSIVTQAQQNLLQKKVTLHLGRVTIDEALHAIEKQVNCTFVYSSSKINTTNKVDLNYTDSPLKQVLTAILGDDAMGLEARGNQINIQPSLGNGTLFGYVQSVDGKPVAYATVSIKGLKQIQTDQNGRFTFEGVKSGIQSISARSIGLNIQTKQVRVLADQTTSINFTLTVDLQQLSEVTINGGFNKFSKKETESVSRLPLKNLENPQVYNVIPKELTQEQIVTDYNDILRNITGGNVSSSNNSSNQSMLRGFRTFNGMRNGMTAYTLVAIDPANIETVEAIKGPSGVLFGASTGSLVTFGGLMNRVSKKPYDTYGGEVSYSGGSWGLSRITADINTPLNVDKTALFRLNTAYHTENSFQDAGFQRNFLLAPSFSLKVNDKLTLLFDAEIYRTTRFLPNNFAIGSTHFTIDNFKNLPLDYKNSLNSNDISSKVGTTNYYGQANYKISDQWRSTTNVSYTMTEYYDAYRLYTSWQTDTTIARAVMAQKPQRQIAQSFQQNFTGDFKLRNMRNRLVVGFNYYYFTANLRYTGITVYDLINIKNQSSLDFSRANLDATLASVKFNNQKNEESSMATYASNVLDVTNRLFLMTSLRVDRYINKGVILNGLTTGDYKQTSVTPKIGLVFQPIKDQISLFTNYMSGFSNQGGSDYVGNTFKPSYAVQAEAGVKFNVFKNKLNMTFSYYNINVDNVLRQDTQNLGFNIQDGKQRSRGVEAEVVVSPFIGFNILAGYGYNDSRYIKSNATIEGKRPLGTPEHIANLWMSYKHQYGSMQGFGLGFGGNYSSTSYFNDINTFTIPAATILSSSLFYDQQKYRVGLKINNLTNQHYWSYIGSPQNPRQFVFNVTYRFN